MLLLSNVGLNHPDIGVNSSPSSPLLPKSFVDGILSDRLTGRGHLKSIVFTEAGHNLRLKLRTFDEAARLSPDQIIYDAEGSTNYMSGFTPQAKRTLLHLAAMHGDVLFLCELLYCGAAADKPDNHGLTPVGLALLQAARVHNTDMWKDTYTVMKLPSTEPNSPANIEYSARLFHVIRILVSQHVNVNQTMERDSDLLELACMCKDPETIKLLLEHGASGLVSLLDVPKFVDSRFGTPHERNMMFRIILSIDKTQKYIPPRACPCFSGKGLHECHAEKSLPYPPEFMCTCGSGKKFKSCCMKKGSAVSERYLPKPVDRIIFFYGSSSEEYTRKVDWFTEQPVYKLLMQPRDLNFDMKGVRIVLEKVAKFGTLDPAFEYAALRMLPPMPSNRYTNIRVWSADQQKRWNDLIDKYMLLEGDGRQNVAIEREAKVETWGGAYLRQCEGKGCRKRESKPKQFKCCVACQIAVYCSTKCQRSTWRFHKERCQSKDQLPQALPSQETIRRYIIHEIGEDTLELWDQQHGTGAA